MDIDDPRTLRENLLSAKIALIDATAWLGMSEVKETYGCIELATGRINDILFLLDSAPSGRE